MDKQTVDQLKQTERFVYFFILTTTLLGCRLGFSGLPSGSLDKDLIEKLTEYKHLKGHYPPCKNSQALIEHMLNGNYYSSDEFDYEYNPNDDSYVLTIYIDGQTEDLIIDSRELNKGNP